MRDCRIGVDSLAEEAIFSGVFVEVPREEWDYLVVFVLDDLAGPLNGGKIIGCPFRRAVSLEESTKKV